MNNRLNRYAGSNAALACFVPDAELFCLKPWKAMTALAADWALIALSFAAAMRVRIRLSM
jgi:hypothetical protein